ncbi:MAG: LptE family protein [Candidatus Alcyoniella australis]|nr:LptE family protein [Candidatus Alcyoniella australis]
MRTRVQPLARWLTALVLIFVFAGCGYHLPRRGHNLPVRIKSLAVPVFANKTFEAGIEDGLTDALILELSKTGWVIVSDVEQADAVVYGTINSFRTSPISFSISELAVEYRAVMSCKVVVEDSSGHKLWNDPNVSERREYEVTSDPFASEAAKQTALDQMAAAIAEQIHDRLFDGFY